MAALGLGPDAPVTAVIAAAGHPVTSHGVSTYDDSVTREVLEATVAGESLGAVAARLVGADAGRRRRRRAGGPRRRRRLVSCRRGSAATSWRPTRWTRPDAERIVAAGRERGRTIGGRLVTLGEVGIGNTTVAAALVACRLGLSRR